jgi:hypothetical protein
MSGGNRYNGHGCVCVCACVPANHDARACCNVPVQPDTLSKMPDTILREGLETIDDDWANPIHLAGENTDQLFEAFLAGANWGPHKTFDYQSKSRQWQVFLFFVVAAGPGGIITYTCVILKLRCALEH